MPKLTEQTALTTPANIDVIHVVDKSDTTSDPTGTSKQVALQHIPSAIATEIKTAYESNAETNAYTDAEKTKLDNLSVLSDTDIKTQYEANADTNAYTDAEKTKLDGLSGGASGGGTFAADIVGSISAGGVVCMNDDGTLSPLKVEAPITAMDNVNAIASHANGNLYYLSIGAVSLYDGDIYVHCYSDLSTIYAYISSVVVTGGNQVQGAEIPVSGSAETVYEQTLFKLSETSYVHFWRGLTTLNGFYTVCTVDPVGAITIGPIGTFANGKSPEDMSLDMLDSAAGEFYIAYTSAVDQKGSIQTCTLSGTTITFGTPFVFESGDNADYVDSVALTRTKVIVDYSISTPRWYHICLTVDTGTNTWTAGPKYTFSSTEIKNIFQSGSLMQRISDTQYLTMFRYPDGQIIQYFTGDCAGTTITTPIGRTTLYASSSGDLAMDRDTWFDEASKTFLCTYNEGATEYCYLYSINTTTHLLELIFRGLMPNCTRRMVLMLGGTGVFILNQTDINKYHYLRSYNILGTSNSDKWIGISQTTGSNSSIDILPLGHVDENQVGLNPGGKYFVGDSGLSEVDNGDPFGRALSATRVLIEGR